MSGTAPCPGTTRLSPSSAETVAALFIIQPNLCLVVSRNAGLHKSCATTSLMTHKHRGNTNPEPEPLGASATDRKPVVTWSSTSGKEHRLDLPVIPGTRHSLVALVSPGSKVYLALGP